MAYPYSRGNPAYVFLLFAGRVFFEAKKKGYPSFKGGGVSVSIGTIRNLCRANSSAGAFSQFIAESKRRVEDFFLQLYEKMQDESDVAFEKIYEQVLEHCMKKYLQEEEYEMFLTFGRNLMTDDMEYHKDRETHILSELRNEIHKKNVKLSESKKLTYVCCLSAGVMLVVILI